MFIYKKSLQYPIRIANPNPALAKIIISQYGGPNGELGASLRYLSQRFAMPSEMVGSIVHQLTRNLTPEEIRAQGFDAYFVDHTLGVFPQAAAGVPWNAISIGVSGDVIADLTEDLAAEQKARATYDNILRLSDDPDVNNVIRFLREREVVHFQRFGEALGLVTEKLNQNNVYYMNPAFPGR